MENLKELLVEELKDLYSAESQLVKALPRLAKKARDVELRTAFQMGFVIFLPFLVIDLVVSSVLMSMGMFMLPPVMVSLPFKLLLFVLVDGWTLVVGATVGSAHISSNWVPSFACSALTITDLPQIS